ncbi:MAG: CapA family protein [Christensenellales bacterium]|jgi:poly-gamma-glutamate capsule biosynthesis protein CapA/YwtB (metallophosphatase superfamily)
MNRGNRGIKIGQYRITPLGIAVFGAIILAAAIIAVIITMNNSAADPTFTPPGSSSANGAPDGATVITTHTPTPAPTTSPTPEPTATPEPTPATATLRVIGEISAGDNILSAALREDGSYDFSDLFGMISGAVGGADYTIANVEGSMGGLRDGYTGRNEYNTPESIIGNLADIGVDMLALANDHALDNFFEGLTDTIENVKSAGMAYTGAAASQAERDTPNIVDINGIRFGFLNYTTTLNSKEKATSEDAVQYGVNLVSKSNAPKDIESARQAGADVVVVIMSWGEEGDRKPVSSMAGVLEVLVKSGADVIIGYGPRTIQPVYWFEVKDDDGLITHRTLCVASVGTFLSDSTEKYLDSGTIFEFTVSEQDDGTFTVENPTSIPTYVWRYPQGDALDYRVLACGEWLEEQPEGMSDEAYSRLLEVWSEVPDIVTDASKISVN